jgi:hypothetical protein
VPLAQGSNQIEISARGSDGLTTRAMVIVYYQTTAQRSVDLEIFLENERKFQLELSAWERPRKKSKRDVDRLRQRGANPGHQCGK